MERAGRAGGSSADGLHLEAHNAAMATPPGSLLLGAEDRSTQRYLLAVTD